MAQRVSLSRRDAQVLAQHSRGCLSRLDYMSAHQLGPVVERLEAALSPRPKKPMRREREKKQAQKKATKRERRASVRTQVEARAGGVCECGCGRPLRGDSFLFVPEMDHFWGKAREESVESCWLLARIDHDQKTCNEPDRKFWLLMFRAHCVRHGYSAQVAKVDRELESLAFSRASAEAGKGGGR